MSARAPATATEPEIHIAGLLVQTRPGRVTGVAAAVAALPGAEVHAMDAAGRLVVVCECAGTAETMNLIDRLRELPGVAGVALVYQHAEPRHAMEEELSDENDPPRIL